MSHLPKASTRRRALALLSVAATAVTGAQLLGPGTSSASSHREAPYIAGDPAVDNTDVYAFVSPDKASTVSLIANWSPFQDPSGGPNFYPWATDAAYDINIDNNGDAKADITYRWTFKNVDTRGTVDHGDKTDHAGTGGKTIKGNGIGGSFLYNDGPVTSLDDPNLLFKQTYTLTETDTSPTGVATSKTLLTDKPVAPSNVGTASMPSYALLRQAAVAGGQIGTGGAGGQSYVGQADDSFFLDLRVFDLLYGTKLNEAGHDSLSHYNVNTIALQVPKAALAGGGDATKNPVIGVWSTTSRSSTRTLALTGSDTSTAASTSPATYDAQVSRLGNPLVNEVVVPANLKDYFNRSRPDQDGALLGKVQNPELPYLVDGIYGIKNPNLLTPAAAATRNDLSAVFLTGISKKVYAGTDFGGIGANTVNADLNSLDLNADIASGGVQPAEYLRLNMGVPVTAKPNRLGVLANDFQGFPNGRRLGDDVIDEALQVTEGVLLGQATGLGDGVNANDKPFLSTFPYIADPNSGSSVTPGQAPLTFRQGFTSAGGKVTLNVVGISPAQPGGKVELFQTTGDGRYVPIGSFPLNAAGTAIATPVVRNIGSGRVAQFYARVLTGPDSNASAGYGPLTTITVR
jgi:hypothetical protein